MTLEWVDVDAIDYPHDRPRYPSRRRWARRKHRVDEGHPARHPVVLKVGGEFLLLMGTTNLSTAERAGHEQVQCQVLHEASDEDRDVFRLMDEFYSSLLPPMRMAEAFSTLRKRHGISLTKLRERTGISPGTVHHYESLLKTLAPDLRKHVDSGALTFKVARAIADMPSEDRQTVMAQPFVRGELNSMSIEKLTKQAKTLNITDMNKMLQAAVCERRDRIEGKGEPEMAIEKVAPATPDDLQASIMEMAAGLETLEVGKVPSYQRVSILKALRLLRSRIDGTVEALESRQPGGREHRLKRLGGGRR